MSVRVRQHVNPLSRKFQRSLVPPDWSICFVNLTQPLHLDIGSARGHFLLGMAQLHPDWNFLGLEIREPLVQEANQRRDRLQLPNLHYLFANANSDLPELLESFPSDRLQYVTIQFPDPWFKNRHKKRRLVQPELVANLGQHLSVGGQVFLQSDVERVALEMCRWFCQSPCFQRQDPPWLCQNPLPVSTEREEMTIAKNQPVYRTLFTKMSTP